MTTHTQKAHTLTAIAGMVGMTVLGVGYSMGARASCTVNAPQKGESLRMPLSLLAPSTNLQAIESLIAHDQENWDGGGSDGIVGVWKFQFISEGNTAIQIPDGVQLDAGHVTWHSDRSELMNSGRAPIVGDFCMGLWKQAGQATFKLNHFASNWVMDPTQVPFGEMTLGPTIIRESVTLGDDKNSYTGEFTITNYGLDGTTVLPPVITGVVYGKRETLQSID